MDSKWFLSLIDLFSFLFLSLLSGKNGFRAMKISFHYGYIAVLWRLKTNKNNQEKKKEELIDRLKHFYYIHFYRCTHESNKIVLHRMTESEALMCFFFVVLTKVTSWNVWNTVLKNFWNFWTQRMSRILLVRKSQSKYLNHNL